MPEKNTNSRVKIYLACSIFVVVIIIAIYIGAYIIRNNETEKIENVVGIDVSAYQGEIDWKQIDKQGVYFAYIKATEGEDYLDKQFKTNWKNIDNTNIRKGAYMFYDFSGNAQKSADFFIKNVPKENNTLPPAIDIELESDSPTQPSKESVQKNLKTIIEAFKKNYGKDPIIYTNFKTYDLYIKDAFKDCPIWICDLSSDEPELEGHDWTFWQVSWRGVLNGLGQDVRFVDVDIYNGNLKEFYEKFDSSFVENAFPMLNN